MSEIAVGVIIGVCVGVVMVAVNSIVSAVRRAKQADRAEAKTTDENKRCIEELQRKRKEDKALNRQTLTMVMTIGEGMIQSGVNGDFKKTFTKQKEEAMKLL